MWLKPRANLPVMPLGWMGLSLPRGKKAKSVSFCSVTEVSVNITAPAQLVVRVTRVTK